MKRWTISCHEHIESGRRYIGLTQYTMMHRWNQHIIQAKQFKTSRSHFANAIIKYGPEAFTHEVLAMSWDLEGANATEETIIEQEGTHDPEKGFNLMKGGQHTPHQIKNPWDRPGYREARNTPEFKEKNLRPLKHRCVLRSQKQKDPQFLRCFLTHRRQEKKNLQFLRLNGLIPSIEIKHLRLLRQQ